MSDKLKNFIIRTLTAAFFVAALVGCILGGPLYFGGLFALITALSVWEFCTLINNQYNVQINPLICTVSGVYLFAAFFGFYSGLTGLGVFIPYLFCLIYLMVAELYLKRLSPIHNWAYTMMSQAYVALPFSLLNALAFTAQGHYGAELPLAVFVFLWCSDTGAYCFGSLLGRHKLFPRISPAKSWEGSVGGALTALGVAFLVSQYELSMPVGVWLGLALTVVVFGTWGDLVESLLKRQLGIKDSGHILPGHGGMLDRFDSSLLAIPAVVVYLFTIEMLF